MTRRRPGSPPLFIVCRHCGIVKTVRKPCEQRQQRFCSRKCANTVHCNISHASRGLGGRVRAHRARLRVLERIKGLSPLDAFRQGYTLGLNSKTRQLKRRAVAA